MKTEKKFSLGMWAVALTLYLALFVVLLPVGLSIASAFIPEVVVPVLGVSLTFNLLHGFTVIVEIVVKFAENYF